MPRTVLFTQNFLVVFMPVGKGVRGGSLEPPRTPLPFGLPLPFVSKGFYTAPSPSICKWSTSLASIQHHCSSQFGCSYVLRLYIKDQQMNVEHVHKCFMLKGHA